MSFPHPDVLHGDVCSYTLHDIGLGCRLKMTVDDLRRELDEVIAALRSGFAANDVTQAFTLTIEGHRSKEVPR